MVFSDGYKPKVQQFGLILGLSGLIVILIGVIGQKSRVNPRSKFDIADAKL